MNDSRLRELEQAWQEQGSSAAGKEYFQELEREGLHPATVVSFLADVVTSEEEDGRERLLNALESAMEQTGWVAFDVRKARYLPSRDVGSILMLSQRVNKEGVRFAVCGPSDSPIRAVISMLGLDNLLALYESVEACAEENSWRVVDRRLVRIRYSD